LDGGKTTQNKETVLVFVMDVTNMINGIGDDLGHSPHNILKTGLYRHQKSVAVQ